ncbi:MAG: PQQ-binding-like beta-propeller repeat protein [Oscillospiraceae bacterium]|nr:PQQ-binding-like beta-propeller repeat protein [Oscillospiraceae bacterium]
MRMKKGLRLFCLLLSCLLLIGVLPSQAQAAESAGKFVLTAEAGGKLVIAPEYITYTGGQTLGEALQNSGHTFTGMDQGQITAIDGVTGNYTRSDQNGGYDLSVPAASVTHFCFSERSSSESKPSDGLLMLMTAMADYLEKEDDVRKAAKTAYDTAKKQFVGCSNDDAKMLASDLNTAIRDYEESLSGMQYTVSFSDGSKVYSSSNYPGVTIRAENPYGKVWTDEGDGALELPTGQYVFCVEQDGLRVEGTIVISKTTTIQVELPDQLWLNTDTFRLSGSYGAETNEEHKFSDAEFDLGTWTNRRTTVPVIDLFSGAVYSYAEHTLSNTPTLTAIYKMANTGEHMEKSLAFESMNSGAYEVLAKGAEGNTVVYRLTNQADDGYTYSQDYTVTFERIPTLTSITVVDQNATDQAATYAFSGTENNYTYKVLDTTTSVTISAQPLEESYSILVNGQLLTDSVTVPVDGVTTAEVVVSAEGYSNTYTLMIQPGEGKTLSFLSDKSVSIEVVNSNGVVMPYTTHRETDTQNRYKYTLVPGETYNYIATKGTYYHISDNFKLEDVANSTITVDFSDMGDWLTDLALGTAKRSQSKNSLPLNTTFSGETHSYQATYVDTEHNAFVWVDSNEKDVEIQAIYHQVFSDDIYHGKEYRIDLVSGRSTGEKLNRFLMDENPVENVLTIRLTKEENGVVYYQDYLVEMKRELTLKDITAQCDGVTTSLVREDGAPGFVSNVKSYDITVSMAAQELELALSRYEDNLCFGEEELGYRILVDGEDVTESGIGVIALDGSMNTQTVTIAVENDKAPDGTGIYTLSILKSPPVEAKFTIAPEDALLNIYEIMSGERLWPDQNGAYQLCEGYSYVYTVTEYGYVGKSGTLDVTRNDNNELVLWDGSNNYPVTESGDGGAVALSWELPKAPDDTSINTGIASAWPNFRGSSTNNAVTSARVPTVAEDSTLFWANKLGAGFDSDAVGSPILVGGDIITYAGDNIFRVDTVTGEILAVGKMDHKSSFSITPPTYAEGIVFVALSNGCVQAFNASTLESLWIYSDPLGGQPNCPLIVRNGYLYTGFWNSETGDANFVCLTITDEDPSQTKEAKCVSWYQTAKGGYYWAGAYVGDGYVLIGTDDGTNRCNSNTSSLLLLDAKTGKLLDRCDNLNGDIRSTIVYDSAANAYYFTSKGGTFYCVQVSGGKLENLWSVTLQNGEGGIPMSTCSPVVYNGRAYVGVSGSSQFGAYSGHNITVLDLNSRTIAYSVQTQGYPQTSGLLTTAYEAESGYVYVYFFDNMTRGKLRVLRDKPGMTAADYVTTEKDYATAYALFTPTGEQAQYAICSPVVDEYGTIYFKNDSAYLMAFGSAIEKIEITTAPNQTSYLAGEKFDPTGMVVTATYANGKTRDITRYVSYNTDALTSQDAVFTITFAHVMYHNQEDGTEMIPGVVTQTPSVTLELSITEGTLGDADGNGKIELTDTQMILDYEAKLLEHELSLVVADVSGDGIIDSNDAVLIQQYIAGQITQFPAEQTE